MGKNRIKTACVHMIGPDMRMDQRPGNPISTLPIRCRHCGFPDIDFIPTPYLLAKGILAPMEIASALRGNFLVHERVRHILKFVVPNACTFHRTADAKSMRPAPWWLAVPNQKLKTLCPPPARPLCSKYHESKVFGSPLAKGWKRMRKFDSRGVDVFKTSEWQAWAIRDTEPPARAGYERDLYFSVRLAHLLKRLRAKGHLGNIQPSRADEAWTEEKLKLLAEHGLVETPSPVVKSSATQRWFRQFLKRNAAKRVKAVDFAAVEAKRKLTLPQDYRDFISTVGPKPFENVNGMEVTSTIVLPPQKLDFKNHRRGQVPELVGEDAEVDGVEFAEMDNGDCFVFDVPVKGNDYPVYWYRHEENTMEPFAPNFAECIKRFAQKN